MTTTRPAPPALLAQDCPTPDEVIGDLDLRGLRGHIAYDEDDGWPTLVVRDVEGTAVEFTAGVCGWQSRRERAAEGAEHLASLALAFAKEIRAYRR